MTATSGKIVLLSGQVGWDAAQEMSGGSDFRGQTWQALRNIDTAMQAAGATKYEFTELPGEGHIIHPTVYGNVDNLEWLFEQVRE